VIVDDGCTIPSAVAEFTVNIYPNPVLSYSADIVKGCVPINVNFVANSGSVSVSSYTWIFGNGMIGNTNPASTIYSVAGVYSPTLIAESQYGCISQTVLVNYIEAYPNPVADFSADSWTVSPLEPTVNFINLSTGGTSYMWDFGDPGSGLFNNSSQLNPSHEYLYSGTYYVTLMVENGYGCRDYVVKPIYVDVVYNVYIPNVFTPDGNGLNDVFQPKGIGIDESEYKMLIFDRWGELIYESNNFQKGWDGSVKGTRGKAKEDVYVYKILIKDLKGKIHEYVGHVTCLPNNNEE
jgi:gliding motility-associated-like protein